MIHLEDLLKTSWKRLEEILERRLEEVLKTSWRRLGKTSWRGLEEIFKASSKCVQDVMKMSRRHLEDVSERRLEDVMKTSWRRLEVIWLRQIYSSWRRLLDKDKEVFKTSSGRHNQDYCLLSYLSLLSRKSFVWSGSKFCFFHRWFNVSKWDVLTYPLSISNHRLHFRLCFKAL